MFSGLSVRYGRGHAIVTVAAWTGRACPVNQVVISEVSSRAVDGVCGGEDWIKLTNPTAVTKYLAGLVLHDDKGWDHADA